MSKFKIIIPVVLVILIAICALLAFYFFPKSNKTYEYAGKKYKINQDFPSDDGCNTCSFDENGEIVCTDMACNDSDGETPASSDSVSITFEYMNNVYKYQASVQKPTPCDTIKVDSVIRESYPEQVDLNITTQASDNICIQVITSEDIEGEIQVSREAIIDVYFNGTLVKAQANK